MKYFVYLALATANSSHSSVKLDDVIEKYGMTPVLRDEQFVDLEESSYARVHNLLRRNTL